MKRAPKDFTELARFLNQVGLSGVQKFLGNQTYDADQGGQNYYGRTADGGYVIGGNQGGYMGFDSTGKFFDLTKYAGNAERPEGAPSSPFTAQLKMVNSDWYKGLFNNVITSMNQPATPTTPTIPTSSSGGGYQYPDYQAQQEAAAAEAEKAAGIKNRDKLYGEYIKAAEATIDDVDGQIARERSNSALMGIHYDMNDEIRAQRLQNYFTEIWAEENQTQLDELIGKWGEPKGFDGYILTRAEEQPEATTGDKVKPSNTFVSSSGQRKQTMEGQGETEDEGPGTVGASLGGRKSLLGI